MDHGAWHKRGAHHDTGALSQLRRANVFSGPRRLKNVSTTVEAWRQWGGPNRDFLVNVTGLADSWPPEGPPVIWTRPLGTGHSSILADGDRLFTMYRRGDGRSRSGPWEAEETVVAMDAATGATIWEYTYDSGLEDFSFGSGPHATPLVVGDRLFTTRHQQAAPRVRHPDGRSALVTRSHPGLRRPTTVDQAPCQIRLRLQPAGVQGPGHLPRSADPVSP